MIELVFIIVILGILASIAVPKMAASREDAKVVSIRQDIGTITQALPAMAMSQGEEAITKFSNVVSINVGNWKEDTNVANGADNQKTLATLKSTIGEGGVTGDKAKGNECVTIKLMQNTTNNNLVVNGQANQADSITVPPKGKYLQLNAKNTNRVCKRISETAEWFILLSGQSVKFD